MFQQQTHIRRFRFPNYRLYNLNLGVITILLIYAFGWNLVMGSDGWLHQPTLRGDSAWFFMCGKSWMSGLIPYVDFTDSKGPLLWLIYGIGYMISPHNFYGVFIFEVISYWITFYVIYRCALLFLNKPSVALCASMCVAPFYFFPGMHSEMRIEDFSHLFMALTFYVFLKTIYFDEYKDKYALLLGISAGCLLMMKYSLFFLVLLPALIILAFLIKHRRRVSWFVIYFLSACLLVVLPFAIYLLSVGAFDDFINEYFINTFKTIFNLRSEESQSLTALRHRWPYRAVGLFFPTHFLATFLRFTLLGLIIIGYLCRKNLWFVFSIAIWYALSMLLLSMVDSEFYFFPLSVFTLGIGILCANLFKNINLPGCIIWGGSLLLLLTLISMNYRYSFFYHTRRDALVNESKEHIAKIINHTEFETGERPTITYFECLDLGEDILTNAVAGTKYWALQAGMTDAMRHHHKNDILLKKPDFIIIEEVIKPQDKIDIETISSQKAAEWKRLGYSIVYTYDPLPLFGEETRVRFLLSSRGTNPI